MSDYENEDEPVSIDQIKKIFAKASGEKKIEVTNDEYDTLLNEAKKKKLSIVKEDESFNLVLEGLTIKIVRETEDDEADEDDWE
jgi:exonuclease I